MSKRTSFFILFSLFVILFLFVSYIIYIKNKKEANPLKSSDTQIITPKPSPVETKEIIKDGPTPAPLQTPQKDKVNIPIAIKDKEKEERWQVILSNINPGKYNYKFLIDGEQKIDSLNDASVTAPDNNNLSLFTIPFNQNLIQPQSNAEGKIVFNFYGEIKNSGRIVGDFNDWEWSIDEFKPANEKAEEKWNKITSDEKLGKIRGKVVDGEGKGISSAIVLASPFRDRAMGSRTTQTDSSGNFKIDYVYVGTYSFMAKAEGFTKTRARGFPQTLNPSGKIENVQIVLSRGGSIAGIVLDDNSKPVSNALVNLGASGGGRRGGRFRDFAFSNSRDSFLTKENGMFLFNNLSGGYYSIDAAHQDFANATQDNIFLAEGQNRDDIRISLLKGLSLKGQVVDNENKPLNGARVEARKIEDRRRMPVPNPFGQASVSKTAVSDENGEFTLINLSPGSNSINGFLDGYYRTNRLIVELEEGKEHEPIQVVLEKAGYITGIVLSPEKKPVPDAMVWVKSERESTNRRYPPFSDVQNFVNTNEKGKFTIEKLSKQLLYRVAAKSPDYAETSVEDAKADGNEITIVLNNGGSISGNVYVIDTNEPVKNAILTAGNRNWMDSNSLTTNTKDNGSYLFDNVPEGMYNVSVSAGEYIAREKRSISVKENEAATNINFEVYKGLTASGKVVDALTERPIGGATVRAFVSDEDGREMSGQTTVTDSEGKFTITNLLAERTYFSASAEGYTEDRNSIRDRGYYDLKPGLVVNDILLKLNPGLVASGNVVNTDNNPVSGAFVQLQGQNQNFRNRFFNEGMSCYSDSAGQYTISNISQAGGKFSLVASHPDYSTTRTNEFTIDSNNPIHQETIILKKGIIISGKVTNRKQEPINNASVRVNTPGLGGRGPSPDTSTYTNSDGIYRLQNLPEGTLSVVVSKEGMAREVKRDVTVKDDDVITDLDFILDEGMILSGSATDDLNNPLSDVEISAANTSGGDGRGRTFSDSNGLFTIDTLDEGKYRVDATYNLITSSGRSRFFMRLENIDAGTDDLALIFEINGSISGRVVSAADYKPVEKYKLSAIKTGNLQGQGGADNRAKVLNISNANGEFWLKNLESGFYKIEITTDDLISGSKSDIKVVSPEETSNIVIELKMGGIVAGKVVSAIDNLPISGANIKLVKSTTGDQSAINLHSDAEGNFEKKNIEAGKYNVTVSQKGYKNNQINNITITEGQRTDLGLIPLIPN